MPPVIPGFVILIIKRKGTTPLSTRVFSQPDLLTHSPVQRQDNEIFLRSHKLRVKPDLRNKMNVWGSLENLTCFFDLWLFFDQY